MTGHRVTPLALAGSTPVAHAGDDSPGEPLATRAPFHLEATVRVLQRRPTNVVDVWQDESYLRVQTTTDGPVLVKVANHGTIDEPNIRFNVIQGAVSARARADLRLMVRRMLGLDVAPAPLERLAESERRLSAAALALRGLRPPRFATLFEAFGNVVPFQQLSLDAGVSIVGRLVELFGKPVDHGARRFYAFPTARDVAEAGTDALKECGLSFRKAETLKRVAGAIVSGELVERRLSRTSSEEAIRVLGELSGIGPWSASLVLLRGFGRLDVFPPNDVGAVRGLTRLMGVEPGPSLDRIIQRFGKYRGYLYFYSLGGSLLAKGLIHPAPAPSPQTARRSASSR